MDLHQLNDIRLDCLRQVGDPHIDQLWKKLDYKQVFKEISECNSNEDLLNNQHFQYFFDNKIQFDSAKVNRAHEFFQQRAGQLFVMLGLSALPYCYAHASGALVLVQSNRLRNDVNNRLLETAQFVVDTCSPGAFLPQNKGFLAIAKVRLIHSIIRYHIHQSGYWDPEKSGIPVNQEDMAGTNLSFSLISIRALRQFGITISNKEAKDYLYLWNLISMWLGVDTMLLPESMREAHWIAKKISDRQVKYSQAGEQLTKHLIAQILRNDKLSQLQGYIGPIITKILGVNYSNAIGLIEPAVVKGEVAIGVVSTLLRTEIMDLDNLQRLLKKESNGEMIALNVPEEFK